MKFVHKDHQFILMIDGSEAGYLKYELKDGVMYLNSTVVHPEYQSNGYAAQLVDHVAAYARQERLQTVPVCSYIVAKYDKGGFEDIDAR